MLDLDGDETDEEEEEDEEGAVIDLPKIVIGSPEDLEQARVAKVLYKVSLRHCHHLHNAD
jgi:hypothetical protein